jgi:hypothetical protein|tara:strand:- start:430 stop:1155 length:726 start_codon:yes stop_codon:yes gene_type:complete
MKGTILQPTYLPWIGYFDMIDIADIYVVFDDVQFSKKSWQQRNYIKTKQGALMLSLSISKAKLTTSIKDIKIFDNKKILENHWKTISLAYKKSTYFEKYKKLFENIYSKNYIFLRDFNLDIIKLVCEIIGIKSSFVNSSDIIIKKNYNDMTKKIIQLCDSVGITTLYDAHGASKILDINVINESNIDFKFQNLNHPSYNQLYGKFIPYMSVIDLIFNEGPKSLSIIREGRKFQNYRDLNTR